MKLSRGLLLSTTILFSHLAYSSTQDLAGLWRSVDDKTGFSKGIVEIKKENNGTYSGTIIEIIPRPGYVAKTHCYKCPEPYKDKPILGMQVLKNMKPDPKKPGEYLGGTIMDPVSGNLYKSKIKLNSLGNRIALRGFVGVEVLGRTQYWIRHNPPAVPTSTEPKLEKTAE